MSSKKKQLTDNRKARFEDEMDDEDSGEVSGDTDEEKEQEDSEEEDDIDGRKKRKAFTKEERVALWKFLFSNYQSYGPYLIWKAFAEKTNGQRHVDCYQKRFYDNMAPHLHQAKCSTELKLSIYKKYKISPNRDYIETLKKHAVVQFDNNNCIVEYKLLEQRPDEDEIDEDYDVPDGRITQEELNDMGNFLQKNYKKYGPWALWTEYAKNKQIYSAELFKLRYRWYLAPNIHNAPFDIKTKLDIYQKCRIVVNEEYVKELERYATIKFRENRTVRRFKMKDEGGELSSGDESENEYPRRVSQKEKDDMWEFVIENFREHVSMTSLFKKYAEVQGTKSPYQTYYARFRRHLAPNLHEIDCSVKTKLEIYKKFQIKVDKKYIEELKRHADVAFKKRVVIEFKMNHDWEDVEEPDDDDMVNGQMAGGTPEYQQDVDGPDRFEPMEMDSAEREPNGSESGDAVDQQLEALIDYGPIGDNGAVADAAPMVEEHVGEYEQHYDSIGDLDLQNQNDEHDGVEEHVGDVSMDIGRPEQEQDADRSLHFGSLNLDDTIGQAENQSENVEFENMEEPIEGLLNNMQHEKTPESGSMSRKRQINGGIEMGDTTAPTAEEPASLSDLPMSQDPPTASANTPQRSSQDDRLPQRKRQRIWLPSDPNVEYIDLTGDENQLVTVKQEDVAWRQSKPRNERVRQFPIGEFVGAMKEVVGVMHESNADLVERMGEKIGEKIGEKMTDVVKESNKNLMTEMTTTIKEAIGSIGKRSGSHVANQQQPGPSEPNRLLKGHLEHLQRHVATIIEKCSDPNENLAQEALHLLSDISKNINDGM